MEIVYLAQNNSFKLYSLVSQYIFTIIVLTVGGFLLGRYVIFKTLISGGIIATIGSILGIILFIVKLIEIGKVYEESRNKDIQ